ncbi:caspase family protein [uncultured Roseivirga sp.]|uniref:caspase family protein n=1 Tax=uncultured Roseivirga sp. TaxID=543088 RepID=UPI000D7B543B|nr:caspase family protein [uncultured Roseivirga sp.]PWL31741.1 MAG: hypothetical protein DCO95_00725 [Roseivirga sp. XM-24bin3]
MTSKLHIKSFAFIVAIEDYRWSKEHGITPVKFARNDAVKFKTLLQEEFAIPEENIVIWIDKEATKSAFENDLKYFISQLDSETRFYFYYAGHGFYQNGYNRITCWDSHPLNLIETTVSLKDIIFDPLEKSNCYQSLIFLDTCSSYLTEKIVSRDLISNLSKKELDSYLQSSGHNATFVSCMPGEKSYPSERLKHGIWTWHLIEALKGNVKEAVLNDEFITDATLKNYLSNAVPKFITESTEHKSVQRPFAIISSSKDFLIRKLEKKTGTSITELPDIKFKSTGIELRKVNYVEITKASGFKPTYFISGKINATTIGFVKSVFEQEIKDDIQYVYQNTKQILSLRRSDITLTVVEGIGTIENDIFKYQVEVDQHPANFKQARVTRRLWIKVKRQALPKNFSDIFPKQINEIELGLEEKIDFDVLVSQFESLEKEEGGTLVDNAFSEEIGYETYSGLQLKLDMNKMTITISPKILMNGLQLIDQSTEFLTKISSDKIDLLKSNFSDLV